MERDLPRRLADEWADLGLAGAGVPDEEVEILAAAYAAWKDSFEALPDALVRDVDPPVRPPAPPSGPG